MLAAAPSDAQGRIHPNRLLGEIRKRLDLNAVLIADGGDMLSFARVALSSATYLDPGPLGCIGLATPFAIGAAKAAPGREVVAVTGDGAFGFSAMEIDTAVRFKLPPMIVVSNNGGCPRRLARPDLPAICRPHPALRCGCGAPVGRLSAQIGHDGADRQIAATALVGGLTVATGNTRHDAPTGVALVNPFGA